MNVARVPGKNKGHIMLYALSTCAWCEKTRKLLGEMGVAYYYQYVDMLGTKAKEETMATIEKWNPSGSFPILVINDEKCIVGFDEDKIREALKP